MNKVVFILLVILFLSCENHSINESEQIITYYDGLKTGDFNQIKATISDSLNIIEGDYIMRFDQEGFYEHFKWDSIFNPIYELKKVEQVGGDFITEIEVRSSRFKFLKNNPLMSRHQFHFESGRISKIENIGFVGTYWKVWENQKSSLVNWIHSNHPELDGFINDLTMQGGLDYLKAIELYENRTVEKINGLGST